MDNVVWFRDLTKEDISIAGGKGANLGEMYNAKLPIPPGFVITANAFKNFLEKNKLREEIYSILNNLDVEDNEALQNASKKIQSIILNANMPDEVKNDIAEAYDNLNINLDAFKNASKEALEIIMTGKEDPFVAVRSSATAEDLPSISENEYVFVILNKKPFFGKIKDLDVMLKPGDDLFVLAMDNFEIEWRRVSHLYKHKVNDRKLFKITTSTGRQTTISPNHTLIVLDEDTLEPKVTEIEKLNGYGKVPVIKGILNFNENLSYIDILDYISKDNIVEYDDKVLIKNNSTNWKIQQGLLREMEITEDFAYFLGIYSAEGTTYGNNCVILTNSNEEIINKIRLFISKLGINSENKINKYSLRVYCKTLVRFLNENCGMPNHEIKGKGKSCRTKQVPSFIFSCSKEIISAYLRGCFDGDGCVDNTISYTSTSERLIAGISILSQLLNIELYIKESKIKHAFILTIPQKELLNFKNKVGFFDTRKIDRLDYLIDEYNKRIKHYEFKNLIPISDNISKKIRKAVEDNLIKQKVIEAYCPICINKIGKSSKYKELERYYCRFCKKTFYSDKVIKKIIDKYVNYDTKGRFLRGGIPWNKSVNTYPNYTVSKYREVLNGNGLVQLAKVFSESIIWDKIVKIEEIKYDSWVYDFTVPEVENFASGLGGIITHNSASFAGQQATFLNVKGLSKLIMAVQKCWASLYTARAIYYRVKNNFPHEKVFIAVIVQKQIQSKTAGVIFSINPATNNESEIVIEAGFGLGEAVVSGSITPDTCVLDKETLKIKDKKISKQDWMFTLDVNLGHTVKRSIENDKRNLQKLSDFEIRKLGELTKKIEEHYGKPQDIEFAIEGSSIYIVQSRPVTTLKKVSNEVKETIDNKGNVKGKVLVKGLAASQGVGIGPVKIVSSVKDLDKITRGDVLVTRMTSPDFVPAMQRAIAIVTDEGGSTSHASIVGREMGLPVIVGTGNATFVLKENQTITVDAINGVVYEGVVKVNVVEEKKEVEREKVEVDTITQIKVITDLADYAEKAASTNADGVGLVRMEFMIVKNGVHPIKYIKENRDEEYVGVLVNGLRGIASAFKGKSVWVRTSDIRTDEYRNLEGGDEESNEDNPMLGIHGIRRGLEEPRLLKAEFTAIKRLHDEGLTNLGVMLPFLISVDELKKAKKIMREVGLEPCENVDFGVMVETPASVKIIRELCEEGIDFVSFGTNDLTQLTLGIDRNNEVLAKYFDEMHPAVLREISEVVSVCKEYNVETSICGQAGSRDDMAEFLVKIGIDSISANMDAVDKIREVVSRAEKKLLLSVARKNLKM